MLETVALFSLQILAVWASLQEGMIFSGLRRWMENVSPKILHKPLFECLTCMGGIWTVIFYLIDWPPYQILDIMIPVIGLNYLLALFKDQFFIPFHGEDNQG